MLKLHPSINKDPKVPLVTSLVLSSEIENDTRIRIVNLLLFVL